MQPVKVFWLEPVDWERVWLRVYKSLNEGPGCPLAYGYHNAMYFLKDRPHGLVAELDSDKDPDRPSADSPYWPTHCDCGYEFQATDRRQVFNMRLYRGAPDKKLYTLQDAPVGAMWDAEWLHDQEWATGPDGIALMVRLPDGSDWAVDQEASNCTRKQWVPVPGQQNTRKWGGRTHYCWVRHGDPRSGNIHVDKNGNTCRAGAGSIQTRKWHGFLHHGFLRV